MAGMLLILLPLEDIMFLQPPRCSCVFSCRAITPNKLQNSTALYTTLLLFYMLPLLLSVSASSTAPTASSINHLIAAYPIFTRTRPPSASELPSGEADISEEVKEGPFYRITAAMFTDSTLFHALFYFLVIKPTITLLFPVFFLAVCMPLMVLVAPAPAVLRV
ncbi:hypothetical protein F5880DRAFT_1619817 [Lentinula raphanica]|nr:hypothetical protein F5880DRAFT_1619817 [Lentinula raphanica]